MMIFYIDGIYTGVDFHVAQNVKACTLIPHCAAPAAGKAAENLYLFFVLA